MFLCHSYDWVLNAKCYVEAEEESHDDASKEDGRRDPGGRVMAEGRVEELVEKGSRSGRGSKGLD